MVDFQTVLVFIPIALALNLTPGADMLFCLSQGLKSGLGAGLAASLGIATGSFIHALAAGLGLAALIAATPLAFEIIRWIGVGYLLWLAINTLRKPLDGMKPTNVPSSGALQAWWNGIFVCLLNPKVALFILALVPQFVDPSRGPVLMQFLIFGGILNIGGTIVNGFVGGSAGSIGQLLARSIYLSRGLRYASSLIFVGLAAKLAFDRR